jgi:hypothetical protein
MRMMIALAIIGAMMGYAAHIRNHVIYYNSLSLKHYQLTKMWKKRADVLESRGDSSGDVARSKAYYHDVMCSHFARAARYPWLSVAPTSPEFIAPSRK